MVTCFSPEYNPDGGSCRQSGFLRYSEIFEKVCGFYLSIGVSYSDFWDGDVDIAKYHRDAFDIAQNRRNNELHRQGAYIYEAMCCVWPLFNPMAKDRTPTPYRETPIPITEKQAKEQETNKNERCLQQGKDFMLQAMTRINTQRKERGD